MRLSTAVAAGRSPPGCRPQNRPDARCRRRGSCRLSERAPHCRRRRTGTASGIVSRFFASTVWLKAPRKSSKSAPKVFAGRGGGVGGTPPPRSVEGMIPHLSPLCNPQPHFSPPRCIATFRPANHLEPYSGFRCPRSGGRVNLVSVRIGSRAPRPPFRQWPWRLWLRFLEPADGAGPGEYVPAGASALRRARCCGRTVHCQQSALGPRAPSDGRIRPL